MTCTNTDHQARTVALRELQAAMDKYNFRPNDSSAVAVRAALARLKARPDECPICPTSEGGLTPRSH